MEGVDNEFSSTFGNYILHGIEEVHLPEATSWMPQTMGWKVLGIVAICVLGVVIFRGLRAWWRKRYRRQAMKQLAELESSTFDWRVVARALPELLKATALQAYSRAEIASLSGNQWLAFLDAHCSGSSFTKETGKQLIALSYLPEPRWNLTEQEAQTLIKSVRYWIIHHQTPISVKAKKSPVANYV